MKSDKLQRHANKYMDKLQDVKVSVKAEKNMFIITYEILLHSHTVTFVLNILLIYYEMYVLYYGGASEC